ncbi:MAG: Crp/Fnr family transcriptional regulator [Deltaproteobacteria bacterium]|nr:Crp/Fnr family transcriptional regulator [Deltaproteobacteria bacterium]
MTRDTGEATSVLRALTERLANLALYRDLPMASLEALAAVAEVRSVQPGERIVEEGTKATSYFLLMDGRLKMTRRMPDGGDSTLALLGPADPISTLSELGGGESDATVQALEPSFCLEIPVSALLKAFAAQPWLIADLLPVLTRYTIDCKTCGDEMSFYRVELRIAKLFLKLANTFGRPRGTGVLLPIHLSRFELAEMTATTLETAARILNRWEREEILLPRDEGFELIDRETLVFIAGGG